MVNAGDYAAVVKALEQVDGGRVVTRVHVLATNNAKSSINGVTQQALATNTATATNSSTGFNGTTDAGTQITITPRSPPPAT